MQKVSMAGKMESGMWGLISRGGGMVGEVEGAVGEVEGMGRRDGG